jgi:hypothetical protein
MQDDGQKYYHSGRGEAYGPVFTTGDIVGALLTHEIRANNWDLSFV